MVSSADFYVKPETEAEILRLAMKAGLTGARLLDDPVTDVIKALGFGDGEIILIVLFLL